MSIVTLLLLLVVIYLQVEDARTTNHALKIGLVERNVWLAKLIQSYGIKALYAVKAIVIGVMVTAYIFARDETVFMVSLAVLAFWYWAVVSNNRAKIAKREKAIKNKSL